MIYSIITVTFNAEYSLPITLSSIRQQTCKDYELIVIDGRSTDNTLSVIESNLDIISYYVSEKDNGIYDAMNKGIIRATGDYCLFLNAGDALFSENVLECVNKEIFDRPNYDLYIGYADYINDNIVVTRRPNFNRLPYTFCHQAIFFRTSSLKINMYDVSYRLSGDSELVYRLINNGSLFVLIDRKIVLEEGGVGATASNLMASTEELYSIPYLVQNTTGIYRSFRKLKIVVYLFLKKFNLIRK